MSEKKILSHTEAISDRELHTASIGERELTTRMGDRAIRALVQHAEQNGFDIDIDKIIIRWECRAVATGTPKEAQ